MTRRKTLEVARKDETGMLRDRLVLIADDDRGILELVRTGLAEHGYRFLEVGDGPQVLTALREHHPDLLLLDVEMPGLGGVDVCRIVKANPSFGFIPVILMTAARRGGKVEGLELGADDYLLKPFDMMELSARVKSMLRLKVLQDTLREKNRELDGINRELEEKRVLLEALSRTDGLTQLLNRRYFDERLAAEFARSARYGSPLSCLLLDIDHFKNVNDSFGHPVGDVVLQQVSATARQTLRDVDVLARYGGEELVALLPETPLENARVAAERVRASIERLALDTQVNEKTVTLKCTVSIGVSTFPSTGVDSAQALIQVADQGLYQAKQMGRNRVGHVASKPASKTGARESEAV